MAMTNASISVDVSDFRRDVFTESLAQMEQVRQQKHRPNLDVVEAGLSLCVPTGVNVQQVRRHLRQSIILYAGLGILGLAAGGAIAFWRQRVGEQPDDHYWMIIAGACSLFGFLFLILGALQERRILRQIVLPRFAGTLPGRLVFLHIEDGATFDKAKLLPEDLGLLVLHPEIGCLRIEGISARYMIYRGDVESIEVRRTGKSHSVLLTCCIGAYRLALALKDQSIAGEVQSQLLHRCSLAKKIRKALSIDDR